jgi:hypothetical protein
MRVDGDQAEGRIFIHLGDDSAFTASRQNDEAEALIRTLQQGDEDVAQGKVKPVSAVVKRLRADR